MVTRWVVLLGMRAGAVYGALVAVVVPAKASRNMFCRGAVADGELLVSPHYDLVRVDDEMRRLTMTTVLWLCFVFCFILGMDIIAAR